MTRIQVQARTSPRGPPQGTVEPLQGLQPAARVRLDDYLSRIRVDGDVRPDAATLRRIHHQHVTHIPFENLSIQAGEPLGLEIGPIYRKIVEEHRGGWCFEMNGLLGWALGEIGFEVGRVGAGVRPTAWSEPLSGTHLVLTVEADGETWLADVGYGDGLREPLPLRDGRVEQGGLTYGLQRLADGSWRFHTHQFGSAPGFDFRCGPADETLLGAQCDRLQTSPESPFVRTLVCQICQTDAIQVLRGRVRRTVRGDGVTEWLLSGPEELEQELRTVFGLAIDAAPLWPAVARRHDELFGPPS